MQRFLNLTYKNQGRDYSGCDCYGLVYLFYRDFLNKDIPEFNLKYNSIRSQCENIEKCRHEFHKVTIPEKYDIILLKRANFRYHCGIYIKKNKMLHIAENMKSAVTDMNDYKLCEKEYYRYGDWHF